MAKVLIVEDELTLANNLADKLRGEGFSCNYVTRW